MIDRWKTERRWASSAATWTEVVTGTTGWKAAGAITHLNSVGEGDWQYKSNAEGSPDGTDAYVISSGTTNLLVAYDFNAEVPTGVTVTGYEVKITRRSIHAPFYIGPILVNFGHTKDIRVGIDDVLYDNINGEEKSDPNYWTLAYSGATYGGSGDTWNRYLRCHSVNK